MSLCGSIRQISIHAPTRGATSQVQMWGFNTAISIHAPTRGATENVPTQKSGNARFQSTLPREERQEPPRIRYRSNTDFNPRSHERSDGQWLRRNHSNQPISIHAPTRGATTLINASPDQVQFQSTLPREERPDAQAKQLESTIFQSTLPREERQQYCTKNLFIFIQYRQ